MGKQANTKTSFGGLLKGVVVCSSISLGLILVAIILAFGFLITNAIIQIMLALSVIELLNEIALIVLTIVAIAQAGEAKQINANNFRLAFGLLIGFYILFMILVLCKVSNVFAFFQLITIILLLIFAVVYKNKLKQ